MATRPRAAAHISRAECRGGISICNAKGASPGAIVESLDLWRVMNADLYRCELLRTSRRQSFFPRFIALPYRLSARPKELSYAFQRCTIRRHRVAFQVEFRREDTVTKHRVHSWVREMMKDDKSICYRYIRI